MFSSNTASRHWHITEALGSWARTVGQKQDFEWQWKGQAAGMLSWYRYPGEVLTYEKRKQTELSG